MILSYQQTAANGLAAILLVGALHAQEVPKSAPAVCVPTKFIGEIDKGQAFEKEFRPGLVFRLQPSTHPENPRGWTIEVLSKQHPGHDYVMVATPPLSVHEPEVSGYELRDNGKSGCRVVATQLPLCADRGRL